MAPPTPNQIYIAVMGVTGSGKSKFIQTLSGEKNIKIGHGMYSCTDRVTEAHLQYGGWSITLIDTPGFNDTSRSETEVLQEITDWLSNTYQAGIRLSGLIYLQRITEPKMYGSTMRNLIMFKELIGPDIFESVLFATTCWDLVENQPGVGEAREEELRTDPNFWQPMLSKGSNLKRFTSRESGLDMLMTLAGRLPVVLRIQDELVDKNISLAHTGAGKAVEAQILKLQEENRIAIAKLEADQKVALERKDEQLKEVLAADRRRLNRQFNLLEEARERLQYQHRNEQRRLQNQLDDMKEEGVKTRRDLEDERRRSEAQLQAQRVQDKLAFDQVVTQLRDHEGRIREEQRRYMEQQISAAQNQRGPNRSSHLLTDLAMTFGSLTMGMLGFPMFAPGLGDVINDVVDAFQN